ncbi:hypothetical protein ONE63_006857 [Megalurothrips usitatus]|uniref:Lebercilin domain-containing protein n=1 Tax=Megalurothrips usitatus TaxID=439358 RepID=A0AAV7XUF4_9NEOP|nr:hypothetical protein ONE63_006857 [Megalurothrips usitatus]
MSAKLLRLKQLQNQLSEAHLQLNELLTENRLLRSLQKRQDLALDRYEGTQAQLPQLVRSHQEEVRVLRTKYKNLKHQCRCVTNTLKEREAELQNLKEQHAHLLKLSKDRNLSERESLTKQVNDLKMTVDNQAGTIQVLNRKVLLETKNLKFQLYQEIQRHKTTQSELQQTYIKMDQLQAQLDMVKGRNSLPASMDRFGKTLSSLKLSGGYKSSKGIIEDKLPSQNFRKSKRAIKESETPISSNSTDPSSVLPDSNPATLSDKTNDFSGSTDFSPELTANDIDVRDMPMSAPKSDSYQFHQRTLQKGSSKINVNFSSSKGSKKIVDTVSLSTNVLENEYENAVAMLAELSTQSSGSFEDDITRSLASLDLTSAKHVAALANATFALKGENLPELKIKQDEPASSRRNSVEEIEDDALLTFSKIQGTPTFEDKRTQDKSLPPVSEGEAVLGNPSDGVENLLGAQNIVSDNVLMKKKSAGSWPEGNTVRPAKSTDDKMEASCKEALLKALKAIDDSSNHGNQSDSSDLSSPRVPTSTTIPQRMFSTLSSSGIGVGDNLGPLKRGQSFK